MKSAWILRERTMSTIYYPAVFHKENNSYWVEFPDLEGCFSSGETIEDALSNAKQALGFYLDKDDDLYERKINKPSPISKIIKEYKNDYVMPVEFDCLEYYKHFKNKAIKKTLTIPEWLNDLATKKNINFSNVLQDALINKLDIK